MPEARDRSANDPPSPSRFAAALFLIALGTAVATEVVSAALTVGTLDLWWALRTGVVVGGVFAGIYSVGTAVTDRWFDGD